MSKNTDSDSKFDFSEFDADPLISDKRSISVPPQAGYFTVEKLPSGFEPMGQIRLEGRAYRKLSQGGVPWWMIITSWVAIALPALFLSGYLIIAALQSFLTESTPLTFSKVCSTLLILGLRLIGLSLMLLIIVRGTRTKLRYVRQQNLDRRSSHR